MCVYRHVRTGGCMLKPSTTYCLSSKCPLPISSVPSALRVNRHGISVHFSCCSNPQKNINKIVMENICVFPLLLKSWSFSTEKSASCKSNSIYSNIRRSLILHSWAYLAIKKTHECVLLDDRQIPYFRFHH